MKRPFAVVTAFALASSVVAALPGAAATTEAKAAAGAQKAASPQHAPAHARLKVAPADEYFGRLKMSILGIRNTIKDLGAKADFQPQKAAEILGSAALTEDAVRDWQRKYPLDPWIPKTAFSLAHLYGKVPTAEAQKKAKIAMAWLVARYPNSSFSRSGRQELAGGTVGTPLAPPAEAIAPPASAPTESPSPVPAPAFSSNLPTPPPSKANQSTTGPAAAPTPLQKALGLPAAPSGGATPQRPT